MRFYSDGYLRHRNGGFNRAEIDEEFIKLILRRRHRGHIIDLAGPGILRRFEQWRRVRGEKDIHLMVERDRGTHKSMLNDMAAVETAYPKGNCPLRLEHSDFWRVLHGDGKRGYPLRFRFVLYCHTRTLRKLRTVERLDDELAALANSNRILSPFYFMITAARRGEMPESRAKNLNNISSILRRNGWKTKNRWFREYGKAVWGNCPMLSCLYLFERKPLN